LGSFGITCFDWVPKADFDQKEISKVSLLQVFFLPQNPKENAMTL
jgi:hypothetical protein